MAQPFLIPYRALQAGDQPRPYLVLALTGINGQSGRVPGLVDTGADGTSLPLGYASLMGYTPATLAVETFGQADGTAQGYRALQPSRARVPEIPDIEWEISPMFASGAQIPLWGRVDFMRQFNVGIFETAQHFTITSA